jgi:hypothetical protein
MLLRIAEKYSVTGGRADDGGAEMNSNRASPHISESVWTHEQAASPPIDAGAAGVARHYAI